MSVLIKGLEMPETEYMDVRIFRDGTATLATGTKPLFMGRARGDGMKDFNKYFIIGTNSDALHDTMNGTVTGELIRCKDCKYFSETVKRGVISRSCGHAYGCICPDPDGHCNFAERKRHDD